MLLAGGAALLYYTLWTILLPFFDSDSPVHEYFPSREWAVRLPAFIVVLGISAMGIFIGSKLITHHSNAAILSERKHK